MHVEHVLTVHLISELIPGQRILGYAYVAFMNCIQYFLPFYGWNDECLITKD